MFDNFFGNNTIEKTTIALLNMFSNINIQMTKADGSVIKEYPVPISAGPRSKLYDIRKEDYSSEGGTKYYLQLPRMVITGPSLSYDPNRAYATNEIRHFYSDTLNIEDIDSFITDIQPVPYDFDFTLSIRTNRMMEWSQIIEQFLPAFNPSAYIRVKEFSNINIERDLKVTIGGIVPVFEGDPQTETTKRSIVSDIAITIKGWIYGYQSTAKIIKYIDSSYIIDNGNSEGVVSEEYITSGGYQDSSIIPEDYSFSATDGEKIYYTSAISYDI